MTYVVFGIALHEAIDNTVIVGVTEDKKLAERKRDEMALEVPRTFKYFVTQTETLTESSRPINSDNLIKYSTKVEPFRDVDDLWVPKMLLWVGAGLGIWCVVMLVTRVL